MTTLDCSSFESALETSAAGLGVAPGTLRHQLCTFDFSALQESLCQQYSYGDLLALHVAGATRHELPAPEVITWFHATRVPPKADFCDGILPLKCSEKRIHSFMTDLLMRVQFDPKWKHVMPRQSEYGMRNYMNRMQTPGGDQGPFAHLVRAAIFEHKALGDHAYLGVPEFIEDLYLAYEGEFGQELRAEYLRATEPCIVVFQTPGAQRPDVLGAALMYVHCVSRRMDLRRACNTCFDGEGKAVLPEAIVRVERGAEIEVQIARH